MPSIPPVDHNLATQGIPDRFLRWFSQLRDILQPVPTMIQSTGNPNGNRSAVRGTFFLRTDGSSGQRLYVKATESGTEGWELIG